MTLSNRAEGFGQPGVVVTSGGIIGAMKLVAKTSGMFLAGWNLVYNALKTDLVECIITVYVDNVAGVPLTLTNALQIGYGANGTAQPGHIIVQDNGVFLANDPGGILLTGANEGFPLDRKPIVLGDIPQTAAILTWSNIIGRSMTSDNNERSVPVGKTCCITLAVTDNHGAQPTNSSVTGYMVEL
jgi:hypothetical protein